MRDVSLACLLAMLLLALRGAAGSPPPLGAPAKPPACTHGPSILVEKAARRLIFFKDGKEARRFRVGLGFAPVGTKASQGDGKTPEGAYRVCRKNPKSRFHLSLGLNYPTPSDAEAGLKAGRITKAQADRIVAASRGSGCPPWDSPLGGEIFIHGCGSSSDWTLGCVALNDPDMDFLYEACPVGTPVEIRP
jgi:murein L,D-transpeptidase YafK